MSGAPYPTDFIRALAHPVLEATGVSAHATIAAFAGSNYAPDERVLPPVPMAARPIRGPYNISDDLMIKHPSSDSSFGKLAIFFLTSKYPEICAMTSWGISQKNEDCCSPQNGSLSLAEIKTSWNMSVTSYYCDSSDTCRLTSKCHVQAIFRGVLAESIHSDDLMMAKL
jgi:hypothetical protein